MAGAPARPVRAAILAGGLATRYGGQPKGLVPVGGVRILDRLVAAVVEAYGAPPLLIANGPGAAEWAPGLEIHPDAITGAAALGGILAAVEAGTGPVACLAWDMPFVPAGLLRRLARDADAFDVILPESGGPRGVEPLCAVYGPATAGAIRAAVAREDLRAIGFHQDLRVARIPLAEVAGFGDPARLFFNVNTPEDAAAAERMA